MFDLSGFEFSAAAVAMTGAVIGWALRPLFLRYRRAFVVGVAALATVGAAAYEMLDDATPVETAIAAHSAPVSRAQLSQPVVTNVTASRVIWNDSPFLSDYFEKAGNTAFADREYDTAIRYWREASAQVTQTSPRQRELAQSIARAQRMADETR